MYETLLLARADLWRNYQDALATLKLAIDVTSGEGCAPSPKQKQAIDKQRRVVRLLESAWQSTWTCTEVAS